MGNSNGSVVAIKQEGDHEKRLRVILNMPVDPLNLPDTEKAEAFVYYLDNSSKMSTNQVLGFIVPTNNCITVLIQNE